MAVAIYDALESGNSDPGAHAGAGDLRHRAGDPDPRQRVLKTADRYKP